MGSWLLAAEAQSCGGTLVVDPEESSPLNQKS